MQTDITKGGCNRRHAVGFGPPDGAGPQGPSRASQRGTTPQHDTSRATVCVALRSGWECPQTPQAPYGRAEHQAGTDTKEGAGHERERGRTTDGVSAEPEGRPSFHWCLASRDRRVHGSPGRHHDATAPHRAGRGEEPWRRDVDLAHHVPVCYDW